MTFDVALLLAQDGITNGAIYALIAIGVVLVFNVSRVVFVSFGDLIAYSALTLAAFQAGRIPSVIWLIVALAVVAAALEAASSIRHRRRVPVSRTALVYLLGPMIPVGFALMLGGAADLPMWLEMALTLGLIVPLGPLIYRVVFQPMANASVLALLMAAVAIHFALSGLALLFFGAEGYRTQPYTSGYVDFGFIRSSTTSIVVLASVLIFVILLFLFFERTLTGKVLRATAVNAVGARFVGIRPAKAGMVAFLLSAIVAGISGILIGPMVTVYYDTGFLVGLKGFVGAVVGGFINYPLALVGALVIGLIEAFASFYSSAFKDAIVFAALIPIVILRWMMSGAHTDDVEEEEI